MAAASIFFSWLEMKDCPPKPGLTDHDQDQIDQIDDVVERLDRRPGIEHDAGLLAERADELKRAMHMRPGFGMHRDPVGAGIGEILDERIHRRNHQMHVERLFRMRLDRFHDRRADGDIGHEMAVHDIDMDEIGARLLDRLDLGAQAREIGRKNGRSDADGAGHAAD